MQRAKADLMHSTAEVMQAPTIESQSGSRNSEGTWGKPISKTIVAMPTAAIAPAVRW